MNKEVIPVNEITNFKTRSDEFFPINWYKDMLLHQPIYYHEKTNTWNLFKYEHVKQVLSNYEFFSSEGSRTTIFVGAKNKQENSWMSACNMDESIFEDPFSLDIHRSNNKKHLTFGNGPHFCLGAPLARLEMKIALEAFLKKFSRIEPVKEFELENNLTASATGQSLTYLPMKVYK